MDYVVLQTNLNNICNFHRYVDFTHLSKQYFLVNKLNLLKQSTVSKFVYISLNLTLHKFRAQIGWDSYISAFVVCAVVKYFNRAYYLTTWRNVIITARSSTTKTAVRLLDGILLNTVDLVITLLLLISYYFTNN